MTSALSRRYAAALFEAAKGQDAVAPVGAGLTALAERLREPEIHAAALDPDSPESTRSEVLAKLTGDAHALVRNVVGVALDRHRESMLPELAEAFRAIELAERGELDGELRSPRPVAADELQRMSTLAEQLSGRRVHLRPVVQPDLIGGLQLRVGNTLYDASLATALGDLRQHLLEVELPG